jgi:hypothetical protein
MDEAMGMPATGQATAGRGNLIQAINALKRQQQAGGGGSAFGGGE